MKPLFILTSDPDLPSVKALLKGAEELSIPALALNSEAVSIIHGNKPKTIKDNQLRFYLEDELTGRTALSPPALVIPRVGSISDEFTMSIVLAMEVAGFTLVNSYSSLVRVRNKLNALLEMLQAKINVLPFSFIREPLSLKREIAEMGGNPILVKFIRGSQGLGVMKTTDSTSASALINAFNRLGYDVYLEKFIGERGKKDLRFLVVKGKVLAAMEKRVQKGEYRGNVHLGAKPTPYIPQKEEVKLAEKVSRLFGLGLCGVDMLKTKERTYILEVNASPGLIGISQATGRSIAREVLLQFYQQRS